MKNNTVDIGKLNVVLENVVKSYIRSYRKNYGKCNEVNSIEKNTDKSISKKSIQMELGYNERDRN